MEVTESGVVMVEEENIADGVRLIEYLVSRAARRAARTRSAPRHRSRVEGSPPPPAPTEREPPSQGVSARCAALASTLSVLRLSHEFLWTAIRCKTEDRFREELAYALDSESAGPVFVAPGVAAGAGRRVDIAELQDGRRSLVIELKQVWGSDPHWRLDGNTRAAVAAHPEAQSPLHAVLLYEGQRARDAATELGILLLEVVHVHTTTTGSFRKDRGLSSEAKLSPAPKKADAVLLSHLRSLGRPYGPIVVADRAVDPKTAVSFSIHAMFAAVT